MRRESRMVAMVSCGAWALAWLASGLSAAEEPGAPRVESALAAARSAADGLGAELRALLMDELRDGGPVAAVAVCARSAQAKTAEYRSRTGVDIRRVSLRHRNAVNAPDDFERGALESFDRLPTEARPKAEHWQVVTEAGRESLRYLRPLVANAMCLSCHGARETLPVGVKAALAKEYPDDRATGVAAGDVRGAISVRIPLPAAVPTAAP